MATLNPEKLCRCHDAPMVKNGRAYACYIKRRATWITGNRQYRTTPAGKASDQRTDAKRIFIGRVYHSRVATIAHAQAINAHIRSRLRAFKQGQSD